MNNTGCDRSEIADIEGIKNRINKLVSDRFASGESVYYLSELGNDLGEDRSLIERISGVKLAQFIKQEFDFDIGVTGENRNVLYIKRDEAVVPMPTMLPRYNRSFWAAFAIPLKNDERRFLNISTLKFYSDEASAQIGGGEIREINADYVAQPESRNPHGIAEQIQRWLTQQKLDSAPFLAKKQCPVGRFRQSVLDVLLGALDDHQRRRVNLPLDIVHALNSREAPS